MRARFDYLRPKLGLSRIRYKLFMAAIGEVLLKFENIVQINGRYLRYAAISWNCCPKIRLRFERKRYGMEAKNGSNFSNFGKEILEAYFRNREKVLF